MADLVIGDQMGMATLESCAEADALAPNAPSVVPSGSNGGGGSVQMVLVDQEQKTGALFDAVMREMALANQRQQTASAFYANQFARPNLPIPQVDDEMLSEMEYLMKKSGRKEPKRAKSVAPRQCATWCGLPFGDKRVDARFAFSATKAFDLESPAFCCPQRPEDAGL